jgi:hypothetical protein
MAATLLAEPTTETTPIPGLLGWGTVRAGLGVSFFGTLLAILCPILIFVVFLTVKENQPPSVLQIVAFPLFVLGWVGGGMLYITGICMGAAAPRGSTIRSWSLGACFLGALSVVMLVLLGVAFSIKVVEYGGEMFRGNQEAAHALGGQGGHQPLSPQAKPVFEPGEAKIIILVFEAVCLLTLLCHLLALRGIASYFHRSSLSLAVICFMLSSIMWVAGLNVIGLREEELSARTLELLVMVLLGGLAILQLWYLALAAMVRRAIGDGLLHGNP